MKPNVAWCSQNCGEIYCSAVCRDAAWAHSHVLLCVGPLTQDHPLVEFKYFAVDHCETLILAAQVFARIVSSSKTAEEVRAGMAEFLRSFHNGHFGDVAPPSGHRTGDVREFSVSVMEQGFALLRRGWEDLAEKTKTPPEKFVPLFESSDFFSKVLGTFELNNHDVEIESPLKRFFQARVDALLKAGDAGRTELAIIEKLLVEKEAIMDLFWDESATGIYDEPQDDDAEVDSESMGPEGMSDCESEHLDADLMESAKSQARSLSSQELLDRWPNFHGTALIRSVAKINHSCRPNVKVEASQDNKSLLRAARPIKAGEEMRICYIDDSLQVTARRKKLREYGFECLCERCLEEA